MPLDLLTRLPDVLLARPGGGRDGQLRAPLCFLLTRQPQLCRGLRAALQPRLNPELCFIGSRLCVLLTHRGKPRTDSSHVRGRSPAGARCISGAGGRLSLLSYLSLSGTRRTTACDLGARHCQRCLRRRARAYSRPVSRCRRSGPLCRLRRGCLRSGASGCHAQTACCALTAEPRLAFRYDLAIPRSSTPTASAA